MQKWDKPFLTYEQQIAKIREKHIVINDIDFTKQILSNCSYYNLINRYQEIFRDSNNPELFKSGTTFEEIYTTNTIDMVLANTLLKYILHIEKSLKSKLSYVVADKYGEWTLPNEEKTLYYGFLNRSNYSNPRQSRDNVLKSIYYIIEYAKADDHTKRGMRKVYVSNSLNYYVANHNHIPPWILATSLSYGTTLLWYSLLKGPDKDRIANSFIKDFSLSKAEKKEYIAVSLKILKDFRNTIAHGGLTTSFVDRRVPKKQIILLSNGIVSETDYQNSDSAKSGIHAVIGIIMTLLNDTFLESALIIDLMNIFKQYYEEDIQIGSKEVWCNFGLPIDFYDRLLSIEEVYLHKKLKFEL